MSRSALEQGQAKRKRSSQRRPWGALLGAALIAAPLLAGPVVPVADAGSTYDVAPRRVRCAAPSTSRAQALVAALKRQRIQT